MKVELVISLLLGIPTFIQMNPPPPPFTSTPTSFVLTFAGAPGFVTTSTGFSSGSEPVCSDYWQSLSFTQSPAQSYGVVCNFMSLFSDAGAASELFYRVSNDAYDPAASWIIQPMPSNLPGNPNNGVDAGFNLPATAGKSVSIGIPALPTGYAYQQICFNGASPINPDGGVVGGWSLDAGCIAATSH